MICTFVQDNLLDGIRGGSHFIRCSVTGQLTLGTDSGDRCLGTDRVQPRLAD